MSKERTSTSIKNWKEDDRPREKLLLKGKSTLSDAELIAILIGSGNRQESALDLAKRILITNQNNLFNLLIKTFDSMDCDQQRLFIKNIKLLMGKTFFSEFRSYIFLKDPESKILDYK